MTGLLPVPIGSGKGKTRRQEPTGPDAYFFGEEGRRLESTEAARALVVPEDDLLPSAFPAFEAVLGDDLMTFFAIDFTSFHAGAGGGKARREKGRKGDGPAGIVSGNRLRCQSERAGGKDKEEGNGRGNGR